MVSFDLSPEVDVAALQRALLKLCGPELVVREAAVAESDFDARFSARARTYRYTVLNRPVPDPFLAATTWHVPDPLDLEQLALACDPFLGEHDFSAFCRRPKADPDMGPVSLVRRVRRAGWTDLGDGVLRFEIEADGVLPPDGAQHRRHDGGGRARRRCGPVTSGGSSARATGRRPPPSPHPRGCASGTSPDRHGRVAAEGRRP